MIFVSYSWIHEEPDYNVLRFVNDLRKNGYEATCDVMYIQKENAINFPKMMAKNFKAADKVIVVLSKEYKRKADKFIGGVGQEYQYIISEIESNSNKYILVSFDKNFHEVVPDFLKGREIIFINKTNPRKYDKLFFRIRNGEEYVFDPPNIIYTEPLPMFLGEEELIDVSSNISRVKYRFQSDIYSYIKKCIEGYREINICVETPQILEILLTFPNSTLLRVFNKYAISRDSRPYGNYLCDFCGRNVQNKILKSIRYDSSYDFFNREKSDYLKVAEYIRERSGDDEIEEKHISYALLQWTKSDTINAIHKSLGKELMDKIIDAVLKDTTDPGLIL
ncbi:SEFIR domain-containing protein [Clostridium cellulovorans]|uniref:SEFIR domain protein n=1 Tax=Clostridium cellulovorans (strain ATCC 35296 / DSM 3052 / OCM 3 / 743B) TaxID=573061 RepID=D9SRC1_CLOC7|nr:toll/interleukin-1 receptor domain-containing protein [Clostridium cellulovorans]ADL52350.1 SEFIR domain protein [Clostridium cellulovorans 743B]